MLLFILYNFTSIDIMWTLPIQEIKLWRCSYKGLTRVRQYCLQCTLLQQDCGKVVTSFDEIVQGCDNLVWQCCSQPCDKVVENK